MWHNLPLGHHDRPAICTEHPISRSETGQRDWVGLLPAGPAPLTRQHNAGIHLLEVSPAGDRHPSACPDFADVAFRVAPLPAYCMFDVLAYEAVVDFAEGLGRRRSLVTWGSRRGPPQRTGPSL
jgi:hypothetical protein